MPCWASVSSSVNCDDSSCCKDRAHGWTRVLGNKASDELASGLSFCWYHCHQIVCGMPRDKASIPTGPGQGSRPQVQAQYVVGARAPQKQQGLPMPSSKDSRATKCNREKNSWPNQPRPGFFFKGEGFPLSPLYLPVPFESLFCCHKHALLIWVEKQTEW